MTSVFVVNYCNDSGNLLMAIFSNFTKASKFANRAKKKYPYCNVYVGSYNVDDDSLDEEESDEIEVMIEKDNR